MKPMPAATAIKGGNSLLHLAVATGIRMPDVDWKPLPTPMWPDGSVMADLPGLILEASFDQGVPTWRVQRRTGKNALPDLISSGTADSFEAAKAAALHVAEASNDRLTDSPERLPPDR